MIRYPTWVKFLTLMFGGSALLWPIASPAVTSPPRSVSSSRQFIIFGGDAHLRGSVAQAADQMKSDLLAILQIPDRWSVPILVNLNPPETNVPEVPAVALNFSQTGAGLKIQLDLLVGREFRPAVLRRETLRALLLEMSYKSMPSLPAGETYNSPPDWLVDGILFLNDTTPQSTDALVSAGATPPSLATFLALHPILLDSQSRALYQACAAALLRMLLASPDGHERLQHYIADWPRASADTLADLHAHFPALGKDDREVEANWRASLAQLATEKQFGLLSFEATSRQLEDCLHQNVARDSSGKNELALEPAVRTPHARFDKAGARALGQRLRLLGAKAHPLLRSIVADYQRAADAVAVGRSRRAGQLLTATTALRQRLTERMREVDDYMNWFEATQARTPSGSFRDYLRSAEITGSIPRRHDPLSVYLDAMEAQVQ